MNLTKFNLKIKAVVVVNNRNPQCYLKVVVVSHIPMQE